MILISKDSRCCVHKGEPSRTFGNFKGTGVKSSPVDLFLMGLQAHGHDKQSTSMSVWKKLVHIAAKLLSVWLIKGPSESSCSQVRWSFLFKLNEVNDHYFIAGAPGKESGNRILKPQFFRMSESASNIFCASTLLLLLETSGFLTWIFFKEGLLSAFSTVHSVGHHVTGVTQS